MGENPLNRSGNYQNIVFDKDIVSTSREILEKFIRELHRLTTYVKVLKTLTMMWYDEYAFLPYNDTIYMNAAPAYKTAAMNARANGAPYGILITTTPGFMTNRVGQEAYQTKDKPTKFSDMWYDINY